MDEIETILLVITATVALIMGNAIGCGVKALYEMRKAERRLNAALHLPVKPLPKVEPKVYQPYQWMG